MTGNIQYLSFCVVCFTYHVLKVHYILQHVSEFPSFLLLNHIPSYECVCVRAPSRFSPDQLFVTLWTIAHQALLSMGFFRQKYWNGLPCPPPGDLHDPRIKPASLMSPALAGGFFITFYSCTLLSVDT